MNVAGAKWWEWLCERFIYRIGKLRLEYLARQLKLIGLIHERLSPEGSEIVVQTGLIPQIYFCDIPSIFQCESLIDEAVTRQLVLKKEFISAAEKIFSTFPTDRTATYFVHVRRGDYTYWPSRTSPAVLPARWYREQMDVIRQKNQKPFFVIASNDIPYTEEMFSDYKDIYISSEDEATDLALMSLCDGGGVLSASSFAWWAAYFVHRQHPDAYFAAPLYWAGHKQNKWFPLGINTRWQTYIPVWE